MKGFKLDLNGDVVLSGGDIVLIQDDELKAQKVRTVIGTNKGEWTLNKNEGLNFNYILGKGITDDMIMTQITDGLRQVDETLYLDDFKCMRDSENRNVSVSFSASNTQNTALTIEQSWNQELILKWLNPKIGA